MWVWVLKVCHNQGGSQRDAADVDFEVDSGRGERQHLTNDTRHTARLPPGLPAQRVPVLRADARHAARDEQPRHDPGQHPGHHQRDVAAAAARRGCAPRLPGCLLGPASLPAARSRGPQRALLLHWFPSLHLTCSPLPALPACRSHCAADWSGAHGHQPAQLPAAAAARAWRGRRGQVCDGGRRIGGWGGGAPSLRCTGWLILCAAQ